MPAIDPSTIVVGMLLAARVPMCPHDMSTLSCNYWLISSESQAIAMGYIVMWGKQYVRRREKNKVSSTNSG